MEEALMSKLMAALLFSASILIPNGTSAQAPQAAGGQAVQSHVRNPNTTADRGRGDRISNAAQQDKLETVDDPLCTPIGVFPCCPPGVICEIPGE
jgi:hypothetical protein